MECLFYKRMPFLSVSVAVGRLVAWTFQAIAIYTWFVTRIWAVAYTWVGARMGFAAYGPVVHMGVGDMLAACMDIVHIWAVPT